MTQPSSHHRFSLLTLAAALLVAAVPTARAVDLLGPYVGGAIGQGRIDTGSLAAPVNTGSFSENHSAFKVLAGIRTIAVVGAEIEYLDLGHPSRSISSSGLIGSADVRMSGAGAFGMFYLPVPVVTVYVKGGVARLEATSNVTGVRPGVGTCPINNPNCAQISQRNSATNTGFAAGAGAQVKLGSLALRAEYERFNAAGGNPGLASVGVTWTFL